MRVLIFTVWAVFGSVSCLVGDGDDDSAVKARLAGSTWKYLFENNCVSPPPQEFKGVENAHTAPQYYQYYVDNYDWEHRNKRSRGSTLDKYLGEREDNSLISIYGNTKVRYEWRWGGSDQFVSMDDKSALLLGAMFRQKKITCLGFQNNFPKLNVKSPELSTDFIPIAETDKGPKTHSWHLVTPDEEKLTLVAPMQEECDDHSHNGYKCYKTDIYVFNKEGEFLEALFDGNNYVGIKAKLLVKVIEDEYKPHGK